MSEELTSEELVPVTIEEQVSQELVKHNYTEAKLREFEEYLKLEIIDDDKESYLIVKDKRKEVKSYRVAVEKFCKFKREDSVKIQKAWVANENKLVSILSNVEDNLEAKEKAYEKKIAEEKEARKRKQEEQLVTRQQTLAAMGVLYSDGNFSIGEVSFELSLIKESEEDVWQEAILPKFKEEYEKTQAEQIEKDRLKAEAEAELKRQQEELEQKKKELAEESERLQQESARQSLEADKRRAQMIEARTNQITSLGFVYTGIEYYKFKEYTILLADIHLHCDADWNGLVADAGMYVEIIKAAEAEDKIKEQKKVELQNKRYEELLPYIKYGEPVEISNLWIHAESGFQEIISEKRRAFEKAEEDRKKQIEEAAAKKERERIEEEQRQAENKRITELRSSRMLMLKNNDLVYHGDCSALGIISEEAWMKDFNELKENRDEIIRKQEEERKAEELLQATEKEKWFSMMAYLEGMVIHPMRSSQYRKKVAILKEKLEEIKAL